MKLLSILFLVFLMSCTKSTEPDPIRVELRGADLSELAQVRNSGYTLYDLDGAPSDMLVSLKAAGMNVVRLRLWNNEQDPISGFAAVSKLSREIKAAGLKVWLTLHYSDTWADPAHQTIPEKWKQLTFSALQDSVYQFTRQVVTDLKPDYIQLGNEINNGLLWPQGNLNQPENLRSLIAAGSRAVHETDASTRIIIHYAGLDGAETFYSLFSPTDYDIIGISYYPNWHGKDLDWIKQRLNRLSSALGKDIVIAETAYPFTLDWNDQTQNLIGSTDQILPQFPPTPAGQRDFLAYLKQMMHEIPAGIGFCYWGGELVSYKGNQATDGSCCENQALWDFKGHALPVQEVFKP